MPKVSKRNEKINFRLNKYIYLGEASLPTIEKNSSLGNKLFSNYNEIKDIQDNCDKFLKACYFNKESIHNILYNSTNIIQIDDKSITKLTNVFYLDLLIKEQTNVLDYEFTKEGIIELCKRMSTINECPKKIIISKIVIDLIESYKGIGKYDNRITEQILDDIAEKCKKEIKKQIKNDKKLFSDYKYDDIIEKRIDILYMDLTISLIANESFTFDYINNILDVLELENINITEKMYQMFIDFINSNENTLKKYYIEKFDDLINIKKININYIILKYILKNQIFIYNIPFLLTTRNVIIEAIRKNLYTLIALTDELDRYVKEKLDYIIKFSVDTNYYSDKYNLMKKSAEEIISNKKLIFAFPLIQMLVDNDINNIINKEKNEPILNEWEKCNKLIEEKKYKKIKKSKLNKLLNFFKEEKNKPLLLKLYNDKLYEFYHNLDINEENANLESSEVECFQVSNSHVLPNENSFPRIDDSTMIIQSYSIRDISDCIELDKNSPCIRLIKPEYDLNLFKKSEKYRVFEFYKLLEKNNCRDSNYQILKVISKGHYITGLNNTKLILYNSNFQKKLEIYFFDRIRNVYESEDRTKIPEEEIHLIVCLWNKVVLIKINIHKYSYTQYTIYKGRFNLIIQEKNEYTIASRKGRYEFDSHNLNLKENVIFIDNYTGGIKIRNSLYALTSHDLYPDSKNKLIIFDFLNNRTLKEITNYSFDYTSVDPYLLHKNNKENIDEEKQILICTCQKEKKNGFLLLNMDLGKKEKKFSEEFQDTKEFEPHCYCQLLNVENNNNINDDITNEDNIQITYTDYFVVGGFDPEKRMGIIKLYKMIYDEENNVKIKYLFDLEMRDDEKNFKGFDMKVTSIQQSKTTGNLLISCLDGTVSLFKPPNFELLRNFY